MLAIFWPEIMIPLYLAVEEEYRDGLWFCLVKGKLPSTGRLKRRQMSNGDKICIRRAI